MKVKVITKITDNIAYYISNSGEKTITYPGLKLGEEYDVYALCSVITHNLTMYLVKLDHGGYEFVSSGAFRVIDNTIDSHWVKKKMNVFTTNDEIQSFEMIIDDRNHLEDLLFRENYMIEKFEEYIKSIGYKIYY